MTFFQMAPNGGLTNPSDSKRQRTECGAPLSVLQSEVDEYGTAMSRADGRGLQTHCTSDIVTARKKAIATMRAWVVRNIQDEDSLAKKNSMAPGPAEERALALLRASGTLVRYRGGAWAKSGLPVEGPGELPVLGEGSRSGTGITVLRKLALKGLIRLDEANGTATLKN